jgi:hypothetical protein
VKSSILESFDLKGVRECSMGFIIVRFCFHTGESRMRWARHVARMKDMIYGYWVFVA